MQCLVQQLDPVAHRRGRAALQVGDAADVGAGDHGGLQFVQMAELAVAQLVRQLGVEHGIGAGRAAAQVRLVARHLHREAERGQVGLDAAPELLPVLQGAGRVEADDLLRVGLARQLRLQHRHQRGQELAQVLGQLADARGPGGVHRVVAQDVAVLLDRHPATGRVHHDRLGARFHMRPPGVDVGPHLRHAAVLVVEVELHRAAAARLGRDHGLDAGGVKHARGRAVDVGHHRRLHAAREHQHLARVRGGRPAAGVLLRGHLALQRLR